MSARVRVALVLAWVVSLAAVAALATAQARETVLLPEPIVVSGADVGFRVVGRQGGVPVGRIVVRFNGAWVEARLGDGKPVLAR